MDMLDETESICPICMARIPARRTVEAGDVYLEKRCPDHGEFKVIIWRDVGSYQSWDRCGLSGRPSAFLTDKQRGCPYDCGLCPEHEQETCTVLMEITDRCDLTCPVCLAGSSQRGHFTPTLQEIEEMLETIIESGGPFPIQLSGGEPSIRDDLPRIVSLVRRKGFDHIQINTNGIRFAQDIDFLGRTMESGASELFLQFDGLDDSVYQTLRGAKLADMKKQVVDNCEKLELGVVLVPTVVPGVNSHLLGEIVQFAKSRMPVIRGIHFQPISYFGRYPNAWQGPRIAIDERIPYGACHGDRDRVTIPDLLKALEYQTEGEIKARDFVPPT